MKDDTYRIPQYVTGLLLCRNLTLEFEGVQGRSSYSYALVAASLDSGADINWGIFKLSARYAGSGFNQKASFEASKTATGMRIRVPGVQMIGYYTEVIPKFPKDEGYDYN